MSVCKYGCGTKFGKYDADKRKYYEEDNKTLHDWNRHLEVLNSNKPKQETNGHSSSNEDLSLEIVLKKLKSIGITLDLQVLRNAVNGDSNGK